MRRPLIGITGRKDNSARLHNSPLIAVGETYIRAVHKVGGTPVILPPVVQADDWATLLNQLDGLLFSGGEDIAPVHYGEAPESWLGGVDDERDDAELGLARLALNQQMPILGICRGHQVLNVALGGTLYQDLAVQVPGSLDHAYTPARPLGTLVHPVTIDSDSELAALLGGTTFQVNSAHHQAVREPGEGLRIVARAPDGVVEALEFPGYPFFVSVQWHPEVMVKFSDEMVPLFEALVTAAAQH